jgi:hypothetical protein
LFVDEAQVAGATMRTLHRILEASGPVADEIGPAISADFDETLAALVERARRLRPAPAGVRFAQRAIAPVEDADERFFGVEANEIMPPRQRTFAIVNRSPEPVG